VVDCGGSLAVFVFVYCIAAVLCLITYCIVLYVVAVLC